MAKDVSKLRRAVMIGIVKAMADMNRMARRMCPVDTGYLRSRIRVELRGNSIVISDDADYASYVEYGTRRMHPRPFIRPAVHAAVRKFLPERIRAEVAKL